MTCFRHYIILRCVRAWRRQRESVLVGLVWTIPLLRPIKKAVRLFSTCAELTAHTRAGGSNKNSRRVPFIQAQTGRLRTRANNKGNSKSSRRVRRIRSSLQPCPWVRPPLPCFELLIVHATVPRHIFLEGDPEEKNSPRHRSR